MTELLVAHLGYLGIALILVLGGLGLPVPEEAPDHPGRGPLAERAGCGGRSPSRRAWRASCSATSSSISSATSTARRCSACR